MTRLLVVADRSIPRRLVDAAMGEHRKLLLFLETKKSKNLKTETFGFRSF